MLAQILNRKSIAAIAIAFLASASFISCATQKPPPRLVNDPSERPESVLPWNQQEKWEQSANLPEAMTEEHR